MIVVLVLIRILQICNSRIRSSWIFHGVDFDWNEGDEHIGVYCWFWIDSFDKIVDLLFDLLHVLKS